jgi:hypothetical protein
MDKQWKKYSEFVVPVPLIFLALSSRHQQNVVHHTRIVVLPRQHDILRFHVEIAILMYQLLNEVVFMLKSDTTNQSMGFEWCKNLIPFSMPFCL